MFAPYQIVYKKRTSRKKTQGRWMLDLPQNIDLDEQTLSKSKKRLISSTIPSNYALRESRMDKFQRFQDNLHSEKKIQLGVYSQTPRKSRYGNEQKNSHKKRIFSATTRIIRDSSEKKSLEQAEYIVKIANFIKKKKKTKWEEQKVKDIYGKQQSEYDKKLKQLEKFYLAKTNQYPRIKRNLKKAPVNPQTKDEKNYIKGWEYKFDEDDIDNF